MVGDDGAVDSLGASSDATDSGGGDGLWRNCLMASLGISFSALRSSILVVGSLMGKHGEDLTRLRGIGRRCGGPLDCSPNVSRAKALLNMQRLGGEVESHIRLNTIHGRWVQPRLNSG